jgi:hypothetical protein
LDRDFRRPCSVGLRFDVSRRVRARRRRSPVRRRFQCLATIDFDGARTLQALRPFGPRGGQSDRAAKSARQIKTQRRLPQRNKPSLPDAQEAPAQAVYYWSSCRCLHKQHEGSGARVGGVASDSCSYRRRRPTAPQPSRRHSEGLDQPWRGGGGQLRELGVEARDLGLERLSGSSRASAASRARSAGRSAGRRSCRASTTS